MREAKAGGGDGSSGGFSGAGPCTSGQYSFQEDTGATPGLQLVEGVMKASVPSIYGPPYVDRIWLSVYYNKIPIYPIFYLLNGECVWRAWGTCRDM